MNLTFNPNWREFFRLSTNDTRLLIDLHPDVVEATGFKIGNGRRSIAEFHLLSYFPPILILNLENALNR